MRTPRLLPLAAIAVGGVLAAKALGAVDGLPAVLASATAYAEAPAPHDKPAAPAAPALKPGATPLPPAKAAPAAGVCAPTAAELAKQAGLSPAELQMLQSLGTRRGQLDAREQALDAQIQLLAAAEIKVDAKIKALNAAKAQVEALVGQADTKTQAEVDRLVVVYEKMKPRDAGAIFATLDDKVRVPVAAKIAAEKPAILGAILAQMGTLEAKKLTESLAHRFDAARAAAEAAQNPIKPGAKVAEATAAPADAKPIQVADAGAIPDAAGDSKPSSPKPARRKPVRSAAAPSPVKARGAADKAGQAKPTPDAKAEEPKVPGSKAAAPDKAASPPPVAAAKPAPTAPAPAKG